jgi:hypothetical protein
MMLSEFILGWVLITGTLNSFTLAMLVRDRKVQRALSMIAANRPPAFTRMPAPSGAEAVLARFLADRTKADAAGRVSTAALYSAFSDWVIRVDEPSWTVKGFSATMSAAGFRKEFRGGVFHLWMGLRLVEAA